MRCSDDVKAVDTLGCRRCCVQSTSAQRFCELAILISCLRTSCEDVHLVSAARPWFPAVLEGPRLMQASMLRVTRGRLAAISPGSLLSRTRPSVCPLITQSVSPPSARSRLLPGTFSSGSGFRGYRGLAASAHDSAAQVEAPGPPLWRRVLGWLLGWILRLALAAGEGPQVLAFSSS